MKYFILIFLILNSFVSYPQETPKTPNTKTEDPLKSTLSKLMDFYDSYDNGSNESLKKAKYNDAIDEISGGTATQKDKDDAFKIIDAYIKADQGKGVEISPKNQEEIANFLLEIENGKQEALEELNSANNDGKIDMVKQKTFNNIDDSGLKVFDDGVHFTWFTFKEYRERELQNGTKPEYIRSTYEILLKKLKKEYKNFVDPKYKYSTNPPF